LFKNKVLIMTAHRKLTLSHGQLIILVGILLAIAVPIDTQQTVYKWVDEDGVVHMGDAPPENAQNVETITIQPAPPAVAPARTPVATQSVDPAPRRPVAPPALELPTAARVDVSGMTLEELDQRCEAAREDKIAPLREAEIKSCKQGKRNDPAECESVNADFGDGGRTVSGGFRPRMFDDLPECAEALQEQNSRGR
jgi:hypothetical protein